MLPKALGQTTALHKTMTNSFALYVCARVCVRVSYGLCVRRCVHRCTCTHVCANEWDRGGKSQQTTVAKCIMYQNNESHLCLLTFWGCCLHFAALCINTHGFNNLGSGVVIDPVGHSPPFLISSSGAWGSAFPMSLHIYILQHWTTSVERGQWPRALSCVLGTTSSAGDDGITCTS